MSTELDSPCGSDSSAVLGVNAEELLPHAYLLAKVAMMLPLFQEARDALTAIREDQRVRHGISKTLADRMDIAGTFSLDDWARDFCPSGKCDNPGRECFGSGCLDA